MFIKNIRVKIVLTVIVMFTVPVMLHSSLYVHSELSSAMKFKNDVYLLDSVAGQVNVYSLTERKWKSPIEFNQNFSSKFCVDENYLFIASDSVLYRYSPLGENKEHFNTFPKRISSILSDDSLLIVLCENGMQILNKNNGNVVIPYDNSIGTSIAFPMGNISFNPNSNIIYGPPVYGNRSVITSVQFDIEKKRFVIKNGEILMRFPQSLRTWILPGNGGIVDNYGHFYDVKELRYQNCFSFSITDMDTTADGISAVLNGSTIGIFKNSCFKSGVISLNKVATRIFIKDTDVFAFSQDTTAINGINISSYSLKDFKPVLPGDTLSPYTQRYRPDEVFFDDTVLYLYSRFWGSIFRWNSIEQTWMTTVPVFRSSKAYVDFSKKHDAIYICNSDPYRIYVVEHAKSSSPELKPFFNLPAASECYGIRCVGDNLIFNDNYHDFYNYIVKLDERTAKYSLLKSGIEKIPDVLPDTLYRFYSVSDIGIGWYEYASDGSMVRGKSSSISPPLYQGYPVRVDPECKYIIVGTGKIYDVESLTRINALSENIIDATWINGVVYTLNNSSIVRWNNPTFAKGPSKKINGSPLRLFTTPDNHLLLTYLNSDSMPIIEIYDTLYNRIKPGIVPALQKYTSAGFVKPENAKIQMFDLQGRKVDEKLIISRRMSGNTISGGVYLQRNLNERKRPVKYVITLSH
jgi:hypothetical protein